MVGRGGVDQKRRRGAKGRAQVETTPLQKAPLISCARLLVTYAPPSTRGGFLMAADQAPRRARSMRARGSEISTA